MKAISIQQPYASLVMCGAKWYETRSFATRKNIGPVMIHASRRISPGGHKVLRSGSVRRLLVGQELDPDNLPCGVLLGVVDLQACQPVEELPPLDLFERFVGNFDPGRFAWRMNPLLTASPTIKCRGALSFWTVPEKLVVEMRAQNFTDWCLRVPMPMPMITPVPAWPPLVNPD